jgi:hypothetical protein
VRDELWLTLAMWAVIGAGLVVCSCGPPSDDEVRREFADFVSTRNSCQASEDCVLVMPGCPLGCNVAVNRRHEAAVREKARELVEDWNGGSRSCEGSCPGPAVAVCSTSGRCGVLLR